MCKFCECYDFRRVGCRAESQDPAIYFPGGSGSAPKEERFKFCPRCGRELQERDFKPVLVLNHMGRDSWSRPVYEGPGERYYVDVDPREDREPDICTKQGNEFDGEPCDPVEARFIFVPCRDTW